MLFLYLITCFIQNDTKTFQISENNRISASEIHADSHTEFWNGDVSAYNFGAMLRIAKSAEHILSPAEIFADSSIVWQRNTDINLLSQEDSVYWVKFSLENKLTQDFSAYLFFNAWKKIELFKVDSAGTVLSKKITGNYLKASERDLVNRRIPFLRDVLRKNETSHYLLRLSRGGPEFWMDDSNEKITALVYSESEILQTEGSLRLVLGFSVGIVITLILFNFSLSLIMRNFAAFFNGLFLLFFEFFYITVYGIGFEYFWPNSVFFDFHAHSIFVSFCIISISQFFRFSLNYRTNFYSKIFNTISYLTLFILITQFLDMRNWNEFFINILFSAAFLTGVFASYKAWKAGLPEAKFFFIGILYMHVIQIFVALSQNGVLPYFYGTITNFDLAQYGGSMMVALYSYGLVLTYKARLADVLVEENKRKVAELEASSLRELERNKSDFFSTMSHEFRTPLTLIINAIHAFSEKTDENKKLAIKSISNNSKRLLRLINHLLDFSKIEAQQMGLNLRNYDLVRFTKFLTSNFKSAANSKGLSLNFSSECKELLCDLDFSKLERVLLNLLSNAIKFTEKGAIKVLLTQEGNEITIEISDSGVGIKEELLPFLFDRFYQVHQGTQREYEGSGIGLSLCKELIELHHGKISVQSSPKFGTRFVVRLPFQRKEETEKWHAMKEDQAQDLERAVLVEGVENQDEILQTIGHQNSILIIEDQKEMRVFLKALLDDKYHVLEAHNGKKGIDLAKSVMPDLILTDIMMPQMDGLTMLNELKNSFETRHIPVLIISGKADEKGRLDGISRGAIDYIVKPFDAAQLRFKIASVLQMYAHFRDHLKESLLLSAPNGTLKNADEQFLIDLKNYILENLKVVSSDSLAAKFALSESTLYRKVKALTGEGSGGFIRKIKLDEAKLLLKQSNKSINFIANHCGFLSPSNFSNLFKQRFQKSPSEFRKAK